MTPPTQPGPRPRPFYRRLGFTTPLRLALFLLSATLMISFSAYHLPNIDVDNVFCGTPPRAVAGECYWYGRPGGVDRLGMILHLAAILPAGILACLQFVPALRRRSPGFHRTNGYIVNALSVVGTVGVLMFTPRAMGGQSIVQAAAVTISTMFIVALVKAQAGIRDGRVDLHRAWMLRAWFYAGSIITLRPILFLLAYLSTLTPKYHAFPCSVVDYILSSSSSSSSNPEKLAELFASCAAYASGDSPDQWTAVRATLSGSPVGTASAVRMGFGTAAWVALALHAVGIEIYLHMTSAEDTRLRKMSEHRRAAAQRARAEFDKREAAEKLE